MIGIIDYGMGNLRSVQKAFEYLGHAVAICRTPAEAEDTSGLVLPGVGAFEDAADHLRKHGLWEFILREIESGKPFLGICLGYQLLFERSEEGRGEVPGLRVLPGTVRRFGNALKVPHMGWNSVDIIGGEPLFRGVPNGSYFYFVHSYYPDPEDQTIIAARTDYQLRFAAAIAYGNIYAVQFHPEKSSREGLRILGNFADICRRDS